MPWNQAQKKVLRVNPDFTGSTVWQQDQTSNIKIIAQRHDFHDEDLAAAISRCLNLDGYNAMAADLDVGSHKVVNVTPGTVAGDAVNKSQLDTVSAAAAAAQANTLTSQSWNGANLVSVRPSGDLTTPINTFTTFKSNGAIRHKLNNQGTGAAAIDVSAANRHFISNTGSLTLTFSGLPAADDADLGANYQVEGQVVIWNETGVGTITIAGAGTPRTIGAQNVTAGVAQILTYIIQRIAGTNQTTLIWSV